MQSTMVATRSPALEWLEKVGVGLVLAVVLGVGFYAVDFHNAHLVERGATPWITEIPAVDRRIPFWPVWVWPYLSYFPLCFVPLFFCGELGRFRRIASAYALTYAPSIVFFYAVPTRMLRPELGGEGLTMAALEWLYRVDPGYNIFPSLHTANAVLVAWIVARYAPRWAWLAWIEACAIMASTVLVKQHYIVDVPAGFALGTLAYFVAFRRAPCRRADSGSGATQNPSGSEEAREGRTRLGA